MDIIDGGVAIVGRAPNSYPAGSLD